MSTHVSVPKHPLTILTPLLNDSPTLGTLETLNKLVNQVLETKETYSVTYSKLPAGFEYATNHLVKMSPHWWPLEDRTGLYEWRDGQRNPDHDIKESQHQLELLSETVYTLSLGAKFLDGKEIKVSCAKWVETLLRVFFVDEETRMMPEVKFAQVYPNERPPRGNHAFVIAARSLILVSRALSLGSLTVNPELEEQMRNWFQTQVDWMQSSEQGQAAREGPANIPDWYHAILCSHLAFLDPSKSAPTALSHLQKLVKQYPTPASLLSKQTNAANCRHRALFRLEVLSLLISNVLNSSSSSTFSIHNSNASQGADSSTLQKEDLLSWFETVIEYTRTVQPGPVELEKENDDKYLAKLAWFEKMLSRWNGVDDIDDKLGAEPNGTRWEEGWTDYQRLLWGLI